MTRFADPLHLGIDKGRLTRFASLLFATPILPIVFVAIYAVAFLRPFPLLVWYRFPQWLIYAILRQISPRHAQAGIALWLWNPVVLNEGVLLVPQIVAMRLIRPSRRCDASYRA